MPQTRSTFSRRDAQRRHALKLCAALLPVVIIFGLLVAPLHAQRGAKRGTQATGQTPAANANTSGTTRHDQPKRVFIGRGSESAQGSRQTIKSDNPLNDYSAYRSGDRFYVVLPRSAADAMPKGGSGRGYSDMQVQRRGNDVVLSYKVQPGSKPRVEQKFNRLDVVFDTDGAATPARANNNARPNQTPQTPATNAAGNTVNNAQTATQNAQPSSAQSLNPNDKRQPTATERNVAVTSTPSPSENAGSNPQAGVVKPELPTSLPPLTSSQTTETPATTPDASSQIAENQPPAAPAPITSTSSATSTTTNTSFGALVLRNWPVALILALLAVGLGLFFTAQKSGAAQSPEAEARQKVARRSMLDEAKTSELASSSAELNAVGEVAQSSASTPAVVAAALAASTLAAKSEEKTSKLKEEKGIEDETLLAQGQPSVAASESDVESAQSVVEAKQPASGAVESSVDEAQPAVAAAEPVADTHLEELAIDATPGVAASTVASSSTDIVPAETASAERVEAETKRLLDGEPYDKRVFADADMMSRQLIASELLSALSGRNVERRERARRAFSEHGFFNETAHDLRFASAPAERASAARALALVGDRAATSHLVAALEDPTMDVRRTAVESLATLRDPKAIAPLEALLERERHQKNKANRKLVQRAIEACREGLEETPATVAANVAPVSAVEPVASETEISKEISHVAESLPVTKATGAPEEIAATPVEASLVGEELTREVVVPEESSVTASDEAKSVASSPSVEASLPFTDAFSVSSLEATAVEVDEAREASPHAGTEILPATETAIESLAAAHTVEAEAETPTLEVSAPVVERAGVEQPGAVEVYEATPVEFETNSTPLPTSSIVHETSAHVDNMTVDDWVELDMNEVKIASPATAIETYAPEVESSHAEPATPVSTMPSATTTNETEVWRGSSTAAEVVAGTQHEESTQATSLADSATPITERSIEPFDELSTVPKAIQVRLSSDEPASRAGAVTELSHLDSGDAFHRICAAFDDDAKEVRSAAARALYQLKSDRADSFTRALREASPERRRNIGAGIAASGLASEALGQLTGESRDKTYEAFSLLFLMAKAGEVQPLVRAIEGHPDTEVRLAVVKLLALSGQKDILPAFRRLAVRGSLPTEVRAAVMEAIYQISSSGQPAAQEQ